MNTNAIETARTKDKALTGAAGEYYVAFRLSEEGYAIGLSIHGARAIDIMASNPDSGKSVAIQVKTMRGAFVQSKKYGPYWKWRVGKSLPEAHESFFYAFVNLKEDPLQRPEVFLVPSNMLEPLLERFPKTGLIRDVWCGIEKKDSRKYLERWDIIRKVLS